MNGSLVGLRFDGGTNQEVIGKSRDTPIRKS
jgi:hypothetical protein